MEILIPGCGNSSNSCYLFIYALSVYLELGADLYDAGFTNVTNIDTSLVVINKMTDRYSDRDEMECTCFYFLFS